MLKTLDELAHTDLRHEGGCSICDCRQCSFGMHCGDCYRVYRAARAAQRELGERRRVEKAGRARRRLERPQVCEITEV